MLPECTLLVPGFIPLVDPLYAAVPHLTALWMWFLLPLVAIISVVYQTVRQPELHKMPRASLWMSIKILVAFALIGIGLNILYNLVTAWHAAGHG